MKKERGSYYEKILLLIAVLTASLSLSACGPKEPETVEEAIEQSKSALENLTEQAEERDKERKADQEK